MATTYVLLEVSSGTSLIHEARAYNFDNKQDLDDYVRMRNEFNLEHENIKKLFDTRVSDITVTQDFIRFCERFIHRFGIRMVPKDVRILLIHMSNNLIKLGIDTAKKYEFGPLGGYEVPEDMVEQFVYDCRIDLTIYKPRL